MPHPGLLLTIMFSIIFVPYTTGLSYAYSYRRYRYLGYQVGDVISANRGRHPEASPTYYDLVDQGPFSFLTYSFLPAIQRCRRTACKPYPP